MEKLDIRVSPVSIKVTECLVDRTVNQHFTARVKGYADGDDNEILNLLNHKEFTVTIRQEDGSEELLFRGIVSQAVISVEGKLKILSIDAVSHTMKLDYKTHVRTFQDRKKTYRRVAEYICEQTPKTAVIYAPEANQITSGLTVQYEETDWVFLKRLAGKLGTLLVVDCQNSFPCFYFGLPYKKHFTLTDVTDYQIRYYDSAHGLAEYCMESRILLELCSYVEFDGRLMRVYGVHTELKGGELRHTYHLRSEVGFQAGDYHNEWIIGCSLLGEVIKAEEDRVSVRIDCDDIRGNNNKRFPYATVYSSPDGTGWYCMPEAGDTVRIYFPDATEDHAYAVSAVHLGAVEDMRRNPDEKSIRTIHDKEIRFTPDKILITNHKGMSIILDDDKGITVKSKKQIRFSASEGISVEGGEKITAEAEHGIILKENESSLIIRDGIRQNGLDIQFK